MARVDSIACERIDSCAGVEGPSEPPPRDEAPGEPPGEPPGGVPGGAPGECALAGLDRGNDPSGVLPSRILGIRTSEPRSLRSEASDARLDGRLEGSCDSGTVSPPLPPAKEGGEAPYRLPAAPPRAAEDIAAASPPLPPSGRPPTGVGESVCCVLPLGKSSMPVRFNPSSAC